MICQGRLVGFSLISILLLSACGGASHSGWQSFPVPIYADATLVNSPQARADLQEAFAFWESKTGRQIFDFRGEWRWGAPYAGDPGKPSEILGNVIFFQNPWPYASQFVGMTTVASGDDGIEAAMVMLNGMVSFCEGECLSDRRVAQRKILAHELGHFIGLSHNSDPNDVMYPDALPGGSLKSLNVDVTTLRTLVP